jgi:CubicO group peptidase (beta-lactamase class C family)
MSEVPLRCLPLAILLLGIAVALAPSAGALAAEPSDLESSLTISVGGVEKTLTLEEAIAALNIPSVSLALIDQDQLAFARAYGEDATPETLYQAASLSKFVAAMGAMRLVDQERLDPGRSLDPPRCRALRLARARGAG